MTGRSIGVVTIAAGRRRHLARQIDSIAHQLHRPDAYVVVDMGGPPIEPNALDRPRVVAATGSGAQLDLARSRNLGCHEVGTDVIVFLDADCIATPTLVGDYAARLAERPGIHAGPVGYLPPRSDDDAWDVDSLDAVADYHERRPHPATPLHRSDRYDLFWSLSFAIDRLSWDRIGGFDERYVGYGGEDTDFARTAQTSGIDLWFGGSAVAFHQFHPSSSPPTQHLDSICRNATVYYDKWGEWPMGGWLQAFVDLGLIAWRPSANAITVVGSAPHTARDAELR